MTLLSAGKSIDPPHLAVEKVARELRDRDKFLICSHVRPDGDCIGSTLGLLYALESMGKTVRAYNQSAIPLNFQFLPGWERISNNRQDGFNPEVMVFVDCGGPDRVADDFETSGFVINIDHHATNEVFGDVNYIDVKATAVGEQIFSIVEKMQIPLTPEIASNLYLAILSDTGGFRYPNTRMHTFEVAARLVDAGANPSRIAQEFYETRSPESLWLQGQVLGNLHLECGGTLCWSEIKWDMYKKVGGEENEPEGLVSEMRGVRGVEVSLLVHELEAGGLRVGIRSKGNVDVSALAQRLGGGGHHNASGAYIVGDYDEIKGRVLEEARRHVKASLGLE
jgi:phosphoesterase RecJ-like protein